MRTDLARRQPFLTALALSFMAIIWISPFAWLFLTAFDPNASGQPSISLPLGRTDDGRPIGVMLSARKGQERLLLELAFELAEYPGGFDG